MHSRGSWNDDTLPVKLLRFLFLQVSKPVLLGVLQVRPSTQVLSVALHPRRLLALW